MACHNCVRAQPHAMCTVLQAHTPGALSQRPVQMEPLPLLPAV